MKYLPLVWRNLLRRKVRTTFTLLSIFVAFLLFGFLMTIRTAFSFGVDMAGVDRLMMLHKMGFLQSLPSSYEGQIEATPGVTLVCNLSWFGGVYQDKANQFAVMAVEPEKYLQAYPEFKVPPNQLKAWLEDRQGALVGQAIATRYGWKIGDKIPIKANITPYRPKTGGETWYFNVAAIYDGDKTIDKTQFLFRYDYFDENRMGGAGTVGWYTIKIADPSRAAEIAATLDAKFANSSSETKTATEKQFVQSFAKQIGDIGAIMVAVLIVVLFNILLIAANTMAQAVRERTNELAVLKTLGFSNGLVLALVLAESLFTALLGGGIGLLLAWVIVAQGDPTGGLLPVFILTGTDVLIGVSLAVLLGVLAGILPAVNAMQLRITDALRRN